jgi:ribonuclease VapC
MIAVDTSALMAIVLDEPEAEACIAALEAEDELLILAGTVAEALIVSARRNVDAEVTSLIDRLGFDVVSVTPASARRIAEAYRLWGAACTLQPSILAIASRMRWRENACPPALRRR